MEKPDAETLVVDPKFLRVDSDIRAATVSWAKWLVEFGAAMGLYPALESSEAQRDLKRMLEEVITKKPDFGLRSLTVKKVWIYEPELEVIHAGSPGSIARPVEPPTKAGIPGPKTGANETRLFHRVERTEEVERVVLDHAIDAKRGEQQPTELETLIAVSAVMLALRSKVRVAGEAKTFSTRWQPVAQEYFCSRPHAVLDGFRLKPARGGDSAVARLASRFDFDDKSKTAVFLAARRGPWPDDRWAEVADDLRNYCEEAAIKNLLILK